jgi:hypothetical protein
MTNQIYNVLVSLDNEADARELNNVQQRSLFEAVRYGYAEPICGTRFKVTGKGHDFISRVDDEAEVENGGPL